VILVTLWLVPLFSVNAWVGSKLPSRSRESASVATVGIVQQWITSTTITTPRFSIAPPAAQDAHVDPLFQAYYAAHAGADVLGQALTAAFPTDQGWVQFFMSGALLQPEPSAQITSTPGSFPAQLIQDGLRDAKTGIVQVPLLHAVLGQGSTVPLAGDGSSRSYADVRSALAPALRVPVPDRPAAYADPNGTPNVFVAEAMQAGTQVGHMVPGPIWTYINRSDVSPDGWQTDYGNPLSEPISLTATIGGSTHAIVAQVFWRAVLLMDPQNPGATGEPTVWQASTGLAYLRTVGPPRVALSAQAPVWALSDAPVQTAAGAGNAIIHIGQNFPFTLVGESQWANGMLWYHVRWQVPHSSGTGWTPATALTFIHPAPNSLATASFDVLSPALAQYLASQGGNAGAVVYDVTRGQYYTYNPDGQFIMASSAKVPILLTFLTMTESQGREPNDSENALLTAMIENSDNEAAQALFDEIGGADPINGFMQSVGIPGLSADPDAWGWSTVSPLAMVRLLTLLHQGKMLNAPDRALALNLMENIESDQQTGVGDTAPPGATVAMKDGWVNGPDGQWAMNSSGIVTVGKETYIIAVYTQEEDTLDAGWAITRQVCGQVAQLLV
jgi:beta-lactamase class A